MTPPAFFDKIARHYDLLTHLYMFGTYGKVRRKIIAKHRQWSGEILDLCCGTGYVCNRIPGKRVVGIDLSLPMLRANQRNQRREDSRRRAHLVRGDIRKLPFPNEHFDEVYFTLAAHEFPDLEWVLDEARRVMKEGASLVIYDLYEPGNPLLKAFLYTFFYYVVEQRSMRVHSHKGWQDLLRSSGFRPQGLEAPFGISALVSALR